MKLAAWLLAGHLLAAGRMPETVELAFVAPEGQPDLVVAEVAGLPAAALARLAARSPSHREWAEILCVTALADPAADPSALPCLLGRWHAGGERLRFQPRFPPAPGMTLIARFDGAGFDRFSTSSSPGSATPSLEHRRSIPELTRRPTTAVVALYPSDDRLPANLLRFYLVFNAPMSAREVLPHVRLVDVASGEPVATAFVEVAGGLWDPQRTRLTLLVHPGRIKRGVGPRMALGPVLEEGRCYRLEVAAEARDADGLPLASGFVRDFEIGPPDRTPPDPERWTLEPPRSPAAPLIVGLVEPADQALLERLVTVVDAAGRPVAGRATAGGEEREWTFEPAAPWRPGRYELVVSAALEDPSGNRPGRRFEEPGEADFGSEAAERPIRLAFEVRPPS